MTFKLNDWYFKVYNSSNDHIPPIPKLVPDIRELFPKYKYTHTINDLLNEDIQKLNLDDEEENQKMFDCVDKLDDNLINVIYCVCINNYILHQLELPEYKYRIINDLESIILKFHLIKVLVDKVEDYKYLTSHNELLNIFTMIPSNSNYNEFKSSVNKIYTDINKYLLIKPEYIYLQKLCIYTVNALMKDYLDTEIFKDYLIILNDKIQYVAHILNSVDNEFMMYSDLYRKSHLVSQYNNYSNLELELNSELDSDVKMDLNSNVKNEINLKNKINSDANIKTETNFDADVNIDLNLDVKSEINTKTETNSDSDSDVIKNSDSVIINYLKTETNSMVKRNLMLIKWISQKILKCFNEIHIFLVDPKNDKLETLNIFNLKINVFIGILYHLYHFIKYDTDALFIMEFIDYDSYNDYDKTNKIVTIKYITLPKVNEIEALNQMINNIDCIIENEYLPENALSKNSYFNQGYLVNSVLTASDNELCIQNDEINIYESLLDNYNLKSEDFTFCSQDFKVEDSKNTSIKEDDIEPKNKFRNSSENEDFVFYDTDSPEDDKIESNLGNIEINEDEIKKYSPSFRKRLQQRHKIIAEPSRLKYCVNLIYADEFIISSS